MNNLAATDVHPSQMWLVSNPFAFQPLVTFNHNQTVMPYLIAQHPFPGQATCNNLPKLDVNTGKKINRKRRNKETFPTNSDTVETASQGVVKTEKSEDECSQKPGLGSSGYPCFSNSKLPAVYVRNTCRACGKFFRSGQLLRQHMLVHTDQRKYQCRYCDRAFKQLSHLQQHHRIHTGEKPYKCQIPGCNRSFPQMSNLQHHYRNHDKPEPPSDRTCMFCDRTYCSEVVLRNHVMKIHLANNNDPLVNQLSKDIQELEKLERKSEDTTQLSHNINLFIKSVSPSKDKNNHDLETEAVQLNENGELGETEPVSNTTCTYSDFAPHTIQKISDGDINNLKENSANEATASLLGLIPLERLRKVRKRIGSVLNASIQSKEGTISNNTDDIHMISLNEYVKLDGKQKLKDTNNTEDLVSHWQEFDEKLSKKSNDYSDTSHMNNKEVEDEEIEPETYDCLTEEMNVKLQGTEYNYVLDSINEEAEVIGSPGLDTTDYENINDARLKDMTHEEDDLILESQISSSFQHDKNQRVAYMFKNVNSESNYAPTHTVNEGKVIDEKVYITGGVKAVVTDNDNTYNQNGKPQNLQTREVFDSSSQNTPGLECVSACLGRAKKRKSFVPQRIVVSNMAQ